MLSSSNLVCIPRPPRTWPASTVLGCAPVAGLMCCWAPTSLRHPSRLCLRDWRCGLVSPQCSIVFGKRTAAAAFILLCLRAPPQHRVRAAQHRVCAAPPQHCVCAVPPQLQHQRSRSRSVVPALRRRSIVPAECSRSIVPAQRSRSIASAQRSRSIVSTQRRRSIVPAQRRRSIVSTQRSGRIVSRSEPGGCCQRRL